MLRGIQIAVWQVEIQELREEKTTEGEQSPLGPTLDLTIQVEHVVKA
jgi:hypothetical protein